ncbi:MAG: hypothetical protein ABI587_09275 [Gemmatimonadales bacterium]
MEDWQDAVRWSRQLDAAPVPTRQEWYRLGDGYLEIRSDDLPFRERLELLFRECAVAAPAADGLPRVSCTVRSPAGANVALVTFDDPEPLDPIRFPLELFPDRGYGEVPSPVPEWRLLTLPTPGGVGILPVSGDRVLVHRSLPWQALVGSIAVSRVFRLQRNLIFLHAGSVGIRGRGVLLIGPKGAGKTTLSLALAARGHTFLGDEIAGVRLDGGSADGQASGSGIMELVPIRRSLAVRDGPRAAAVGTALDREAAPYEPFPDGTSRRRAFAGQLFPEPAVALPLRRLVFLRGKGPTARLEQAPVGRDLLSMLTPLGASMWGRPPMQALRDLLRIVSAVPAVLLHLGPPEETADLLTKSLEE